MKLIVVTLVGVLLVGCQHGSLERGPERSPIDVPRPSPSIVPCDDVGCTTVTSKR